MKFCALNGILILSATFLYIFLIIIPDTRKGRGGDEKTERRRFA